jgi:type I restriction enzyme S subunit
MNFGWETTPIGDVVVPVHRPEVPQSGLSYRQIGVRLWGHGAYEREAIDGADTQYKTLNRVEAGDLIINKIWARNGSASVVQNELTGCFCSGEFPLFRPDVSKTEPAWLYWITRTKWFWQNCDEKSRGTSGKNRIRPERFLEIIIPLPDIKEQRRIITKLEMLSAEIDEARLLRQEIQSDAQAMLHSAFQQVIEGAEYYPMSEVAPIVRRKVEIEMDGEYPELGVRSFGNGVFHKPTLIGSELDWQKLYRVQEGDLIISNIKAWEGAIAVADRNDHNRVGSHRYITCVPKKGLTTANFLCFYLLTEDGLEKVQEASPGSADRNRTLAMKRLEKIEVPIPAYDKQLWFDSLQTKAAAIKQAHSANQAELDALLPAILDKAFKGAL